MQVRLQKIIAASGLASRRRAEDFIRQGRVTVNGAIVRKLGSCVDPAVDHIKVDGNHVGSAEPEVFILMHKPAGYLTTMKDPQGRPTVADLLGRVRLRVVPVGRLDFDAEGLLLLTNNGQIAQACLHPKYHVAKTYLVKVTKVLTEEELALLRQGVQLEDGITSPAVVKKSGKARVNSWIEMTIFEGRSHQIKRMLEALGHRVQRLKRIRFGPLALGDLLPGTLRFATDAEANALRSIPGRTPRRKKHFSQITRIPESTTRSVTPQERRGPVPSRQSERPRPGAQKFSRKSSVKNTPKTPQPNSAFSKSPREITRTPAKSETGMMTPRGGSKRPKSKRPSFPRGVKPQVVLQAFLDYEKEELDKHKERMTHRPSIQQPARGRTSDAQSAAPSRADRSRNRRSRNSPTPRPSTPKGSTRPTASPRPKKISAQKRNRA